MRPDRFTTKSQEALAAALSLAAARKHPEAAPEHLLLGAARAGRRRRAARAAQARRRRRSRCAPTSTPRLDALPTLASADEPATGRELLNVLRAAEGEAGKLRDEYISSRAPAARARRPAGAAGDALRADGASRDGAAEGRRGGARAAPRDRPEPRGQVPGAREVRPRPHRGRARRQARPGDRARRRDPPRDPGALAPHEEQPGPDRRAGRRQDGDRRGPRPADRRRATCPSRCATAG